MTHRPPVRDWSTDFDHTDPQWVADPFPIWDELRGECPVAHSDRYGGTWLPVTHEDVAAVAYDTEHFTSRSVVVSELRPDDDDLPAPIGSRRRSPPTRRSTAGAPPAAAGVRAEADRATRAVHAGVVPRAARSHRRPARVRRRGRLRAGHPVAGHREDARLPREDADQLPRLHSPRPRRRRRDRGGAPGADRRERARRRTSTRASRSISSSPRDDLTSFLLEAELDGQKLHPDHVRGTMVLLMIAGIDTTWSAIGASLWHLAQHPDDRARLAADPAHGDRGRGVPSRVRAGDDGAAGRRGLRVPGLPVEAGRLGPAAVPRREP